MRNNIILSLIFVAAVAIPSYIMSKMKPPQPEACEQHFSKWEPVQRQWDNTWTQVRYDTNTGFAEMRIVLKP